MKAHRVSFFVFIALIIATVVVFGLFFGVGYDNPQGKYNAPEHTGTLIVFMYIMAAICILATVLGALGNTIASFGGPKGVNITGVPDRAVSIVSVVILVGIMVGSWAMASDEPLRLANGSYFSDAALLKVSDLFCYSLYALLAVATLALIVNLSGIFKK